MEPEQTTHSANNADIQALPPPVVQRQNPKWVGPIMAFMIPGSAHFLAGQRRTGILLYFAVAFFSLLPLFPLSVPGIGFFYGAIGLCILYILFFIGVLISSWRPTRRFGCLGWLLFIGAVLFLNNAFDYAILKPGATFMKTYVVESFAMNGQAMNPTLLAPTEHAPEVLHRDKIIANKWLYRISDPQRGDIAIFKVTDPRDGSQENWIMRVVGLPGETVDIESPYVLINGERLTEPAIFAKIASRQDGFTGYYSAQELEGGDEVGSVPLPLTLGPDEYFVLGDNSPRSIDSRFLGPILRQDITGKAIRIYYPFSRVREL
jgi:signal peptidase I